MREQEAHRMPQRRGNFCGSRAVAGLQVELDARPFLPGGVIAQGTKLITAGAAAGSRMKPCVSIACAAPLLS